MARSKKAILRVHAVTKKARANKLVTERKTTIGVVSSMDSNEVAAQIMSQLDVTTTCTRRLVAYDGKDGMKMGKVGGKDVFFPAIEEDDPDDEDADDADDADADVNAFPEGLPVYGLTHIVDEAKKASLTGVAPEDALIDWTVSAKKVEAILVMVMATNEFNRANGTGQGVMSHPAVQPLVKTAFNLHAVREPTANTRIGSANLPDYYTRVVLALSQGLSLTYEQAQCKPYVRDAKCPFGHSRRLRVIERERRTLALTQIFRDNPELMKGLAEGMRELEGLWQRHKDQVGREMQKDAANPSAPFRDATEAHLKLYGCATLEELALESGKPEEILTEVILQAFKKLNHKLKPSTELALKAAKEAAEACAREAGASDSNEAEEGAVDAQGQQAAGAQNIPSDLEDSADESDGDDRDAAAEHEEDAAVKAVAEAGLASDSDADEVPAAMAPEEDAGQQEPVGDAAGSSAAGTALPRAAGPVAAAPRAAETPGELTQPGAVNGADDRVNSAASSRKRSASGGQPKKKQQKTAPACQSAAAKARGGKKETGGKVTRRQAAVMRPIQG